MRVETVEIIGVSRYQPSFFQACRGLMFLLIEQAFCVFVDDRQYHILQFRIAYRLGEPGVFGGFLEPGLGVQKLQIVLFGGQSN